MAQQESNNEVDFFHKTVDKTLKRVNRMPFYKLAFLAIGIGCSFALMNGVVHYYHTRSEANAKIEVIEAQRNAEIAQETAKRMANQKEATLHNLSNKIFAINEQDFNGFVEYLKKHQNLYDPQIKLITDSIIAAQQADSKHALDGLKESQNLMNAMGAYKKNYENKISQFQTVYQAVHDKENFDTQVATQLLGYFNNYRANLMIHDVPLEQTINAYVFAKNKENVSYNLEHKVLEQIRNLETDSENSFKGKVKP